MSTHPDAVVHEDAPSAAGEFGAGWSTLAIALVGIAIGISSTFFLSVGLFVKSISAEFGWGRGIVSSMPLIMTLVTASLSPLVGRFVDRFGALPIATISVAGYALSLLLFARLTVGLWSFFALIILLAATGAGTIPLPFTKLVVGAFVRFRGLALGLAMAGTGLGSALVARFVSPVVQKAGWRAGYEAMAGGVACGLVVILALWIATRGRHAADGPARSPLAVDTAETETMGRGELLRNPAFRLLAAIFFLASFGILTLVVHFVPMLTDAGMTLAQAGAVAGVIGIALIAGRIVTGLLLDRVAAETLGALLFLSVAAGILLLLFGGSRLALPAAIIAGFGVGAEVDVMAFLTGRYFRLARYGAAYGGLYGVFLLGSAAGPATAGWLFDLTGNYDLALVLAAGTLISAALLLMSFGRLIGPRPR